MTVPVWVSVIGAVSTLVGLVLVALINRGKSRENQMIDQLQEDNKDLRTRVETLEDNQTNAETWKLKVVMYILDIHRHFADGNPPPPPPIPSDLLEFKYYKGGV